MRRLSARRAQALRQPATRPGLYVFSSSGHAHDDLDPTATEPSLIAGTVVAILGLSACVIGALIVVFMLVSLVFPSLTISALLAKNMIYYAGHTLANLQIYVAAGIAYSVLPAYTNRPWRLSRALVGGWLATLAIVMLAFFHHLYQDFAQPEAVQWVGNVASYAAAIPPMTVTIYGGLVQVWRSGIRWSAAPLFTFMAVAGVHGGAERSEDVSLRFSHREEVPTSYSSGPIALPIAVIATRSARPYRT